MVNYRGKLDITADILNVVSHNPKKTHIMYQANLSFRVLEKYLAELTLASLIRFEDTAHCYVLTTKGQQFLEAYRTYSKTHRRIEKVMNDVNAKRENLERLFST